jgi:predicted outer membrane repeat protein
MSNGGSVTLTNCTLTDNTAAGIGGAINNEGSILTLTNSTLAGNTSLGSTDPAQGGAIFNFDVPLTLIHCTFTGNTATGYGAAIRTLGGTLTIQNTIIAGNTSGSGPDIGYGGGTFNIQGANLIGSNETVAAQFPAGPLVGTTAAPRNPRLAPLGDFGGPTQTMPPLPGSPAINAAVLLGSTPASDQRGHARPSGLLPDLGAVEAFDFTTLAPVDADRDGIDDRLEPGYGLVVGNDDSAADSDGDGSRDRDEIASMTNPLDPTDYFRILSFTKAAGFTPANPVFDLTLSTVPGLRYCLEESTTLQDWTALPNSEFVAAAGTHHMQAELYPGRDLVRGCRLDSRRWASQVLGFSSQYSENAWAAARALGQPDTYPTYGDISTAWASETADDSPEYLELGFDNPGPISAVAIYETLAPGAVTKVSVRNATNSQWVEVYSGVAVPAAAAARIFTVNFPTTAFPVDGVRIDLDSQAVPDWNEIDAVCIIRSDP